MFTFSWVKRFADDETQSDGSIRLFERNALLSAPSNTKFRIAITTDNIQFFW
jgi:hypothetical protein